LRFSGFCRHQHIQDPTWNQNPFLNRLGNRSKSCFVGFRCFGNNSYCFHFASLSCSFHVAFISFLFVPTAMEMGFWLGQGTKCNMLFSAGYP
jgi:hypothetical protein